MPVTGLLFSTAAASCLTWQVSPWDLDWIVSYMYASKPSQLCAHGTEEESEEAWFGWKRRREDAEYYLCAPPRPVGSWNLPRLPPLTTICTLRILPCMHGHGHLADALLCGVVVVRRRSWPCCTVNWRPTCRCWSVPQKRRGTPSPACTLFDGAAVEQCAMLRQQPAYLPTPTTPVSGNLGASPLAPVLWLTLLLEKRAATSTCKM